MSLRRPLEYESLVKKRKVKVVVVPDDSQAQVVLESLSLAQMPHLQESLSQAQMQQQHVVQESLSQAQMPEESQLPESF